MTRTQLVKTYFVGVPVYRPVIIRTRILLYTRDRKYASIGMEPVNPWWHKSMWKFEIEHCAPIHISSL